MENFNPLKETAGSFLHKIQQEAAATMRWAERIETAPRFFRPIAVGLGGITKVGCAVRTEIAALNLETVTATDGNDLSCGLGDRAYRKVCYSRFALATIKTDSQGLE